MGMNSYADSQKWAMEQAAGQASMLAPSRMTRRQQLEWRRKEVAHQLDTIDKAIAALDAHPELEEFMETMANAGA